MKESKMKAKTNRNAKKNHTVSFQGTYDVHGCILKIFTIPFLPVPSEGKTWLCIGGKLTSHDGQCTTHLTFCQGHWKKDIFEPIEKNKTASLDDLLNIKKL